MEKFVKVKQASRKIRHLGYFVGLSALGMGAALASTGGPFGKISSFLSTNFMPGIGAIGVAGGVGYAAVHAFKHDYGKAVVGLGVAAGGGFFISNSSWVQTKTGISSATIGAHLPVIHAALHAFGM